MPNIMRTVLKGARAIPALLCFLLLFRLYTPWQAVLSLLSVAAHEWGHIVVYYIMKKEWPRLGLQKGGLCLSSSVFTYRQEFFYAAGGIIGNLATTVLVLPFLHTAAGQHFVSVSLLYILFNILPAPPLDGEKLLRLLLTRLFSENSAYRAVRVSSLTVIALFFIVSLYFFLGNGSCFYGIFISFCLLSAHCHTFSEFER